jgi:membrane dipeptidase
MAGLLASTPLVDGHNDLAWSIRQNNAERSTLGDEIDLLRRKSPAHTDLTRLRTGRIGARFWSFYAPGELREA